MFSGRTTPEIPYTVWKQVSEYCETPLELINLSRVSRNAYVAATSDALWAPFTPYNLTNHLYRNFVERVRKLAQTDVDLILEFWPNAVLIRTTARAGAAPYSEPLPEHKPFDFSQLDVALAVACGHEDLDDYDAFITMFEQCLTDPHFATALLQYDPAKFLRYDLLQRPEYLPLATGLPDIWMHVCPALLEELRRDTELINNTIRNYPLAFIWIFSAQYPCTDRDLALQCVEDLETILKPWHFADEFWDALHPTLHSCSFYLELGHRGFPINIYVPEMAKDKHFYIDCHKLKKFPSEFLKDKDTVLAAVQRDMDNYIRADPDLKCDKDVVLQTLQSDIYSLSLFSDHITKQPWFATALKSVLLNVSHKPFYIPIPGHLRTREIAEIAARKGFLAMFPEFLKDLDLLKIAVTVSPDILCQLEDSGKYAWELCQVNPVAVWYTTYEFFTTNPRIVMKAFQYGLQPDYLSRYPIIWDNHRSLLLHAVRSNRNTFKLLASCHHEYYQDKELILAALEVSDGSILWDLPYELMDDRDIWAKVAATRSPQHNQDLDRHLEETMARWGKTSITLKSPFWRVSVQRMPLVKHHSSEEIKLGA